MATDVAGSKSGDQVRAEAATAAIKKYRRLLRHLWAWAVVADYRNAGGQGYPSLADVTGQAYRKTGSRGLSNLQASYCDIEAVLNDLVTPPILRDLLWFQFALPIRFDEDGSNRSIPQFVDRVFGEAATSRRDVAPLRSDHRQLVSFIKAQRRLWMQRAAEELFPDLYVPSSHQRRAA